LRKIIFIIIFIIFKYNLEAQELKDFIKFKNEIDTISFLKDRIKEIEIYYKTDGKIYNGRL